MSVSRTSMRLVTAALVAVIGLGATSTLGATALPALAGAGWDTVPTDSTDGAGWDVAPVVLASSIDGAGWDIAPTTTDDSTDGAGWDVAPATTDGAGWDSVPTDPSTDGAGWD
ncbi:hypothetical protein [Streptomyces hydrogenans]|uniref:hypothetical protein n=2 Tax=Streptomyces hydrogenans TaxID=1873719 RepID=UPI0038225C8D